MSSCRTCQNPASDACDNELCGKCCRQEFDQFSDSDEERNDCDFHGVVTCRACYELAIEGCANGSCSEFHCATKLCPVHPNVCTAKLCDNKRAAKCSTNRCRT